MFASASLCKAPRGNEGPVAGPSAEHCGCGTSRRCEGWQGCLLSQAAVSSELWCCWEARRTRLAWEAAFPPCQPPDTNSPTDLCPGSNLPTAQAAPPGPTHIWGSAGVLPDPSREEQSSSQLPSFSQGSSHCFPHPPSHKGHSSCRQSSSSCRTDPVRIRGRIQTAAGALRGSLLHC